MSSRVEHLPRHTLKLECGCVVFLRGGEPFGRAVRSADRGQPVELYRLCPIHARQLVTVIVCNHRDGHA